jgi:hypothetical protein
MAIRKKNTVASKGVNIYFSKIIIETNKKMFFGLFFQYLVKYSIIEQMSFS